MVLLSCKCLNVKIHTASEIIHEITDDIRNGLPHELLHSSSDDDDDDSSSGLVALGLGGITTEHPVLVIERFVCKRWIVRHCTSCRTDVVVMSASDDASHSDVVIPPNHVVIVKNSLLVGLKRINEVKQSNSDYSMVYNIVMPSGASSVGSGLLKRPELATVLDQFQLLAETSVAKERASMEERIQSYQDAQMKAFSDFQRHAARDVRSMFELVRRAQEETIAEAISDALSDTIEISEVGLSSPNYNGHTIAFVSTVEESSCKTAVSEAPELKNIQDIKIMNKKVSPTIRKKEPKATETPYSKNDMSSTITVTDVSDKGGALNDIFDNQIPFFYVGEASPDSDNVFDNDTDDEVYDDGSTKEENVDVVQNGIASVVIGRNSGTASKLSVSAKILATSIPIQVPTNFNGHSFDFDESSPRLSGSARSPDPKHLAASMMEISRMSTAASSMPFGDLPSQPYPRSYGHQLS